MTIINLIFHPGNDKHHLYGCDSSPAPCYPFTLFRSGRFINSGANTGLYFKKVTTSIFCRGAGH